MRTSRVSALPYWWSARTYSTSAPSIGGVAERTHQEGNVVVLAGIGNREGDCDFGEKRRHVDARAGGPAPPSEVVAGVENQPVDARRDVVRPQGGDSAIGTRRSRGYLLDAGVRDVLQADAQSGRGAAGGNIQHVGRDRTHDEPARKRSSRSALIFCSSARTTCHSSSGLFSSLPRSNWSNSCPVRPEAQTR